MNLSRGGSGNLFEYSGCTKWTEIAGGKKNITITMTIGFKWVCVYGISCAMFSYNCTFLSSLCKQEKANQQDAWNGIAPEHFIKDHRYKLTTWQLIIPLCTTKYNHPLIKFSRVNQNLLKNLWVLERVKDFDTDQVLKLKLNDCGKF